MENIPPAPEIEGALEEMMKIVSGAGDRETARKELERYFVRKIITEPLTKAIAELISGGSLGKINKID